MSIPPHEAALTPSPQPRLPYLRDVHRKNVVAPSLGYTRVLLERKRRDTATRQTQMSHLRRRNSYLLPSPQILKKRSLSLRVLLLYCSAPKKRRLPPRHEELLVRVDKCGGRSLRLWCNKRAEPEACAGHMKNDTFHAIRPL